jgi:hypothetical protein
MVFKFGLALSSCGTALERVFMVAESMVLPMASGSLAILFLCQLLRLRFHGATVV